MELLKIPYKITALETANNGTKVDWFDKINANGKIPAIVDPNTNVTILQSGAIFQNFAENYDKDYKFSYPSTPEYYSQKEPSFFQVGENGPSQGQATHFNVFNKGVSEYARFTDEFNRIYGFAEQYLIRNPSGLYLVGDHDCATYIAFYSRIQFSGFLGIVFRAWPKLAKWVETLVLMKRLRMALKNLQEMYDK